MARPEAARRPEAAPQVRHRAVRVADRSLAVRELQHLGAGRSWDHRAADRNLAARLLAVLPLEAARNPAAQRAASARQPKAAQHRASCLLVEDEEPQPVQEQPLGLRVVERPRVRGRPRA